MASWFLFSLSLSLSLSHTHTHTLSLSRSLSFHRFHQGQTLLRVQPLRDATNTNSTVEEGGGRRQPYSPDPMMQQDRWPPTPSSSDLRLAHKLMREADDLSVPDAPMSDTDDDDDDDYDKKPPASVSGKPLLSLSFHNNMSLARSLTHSLSLSLSLSPTNRERGKANQRRFHSRYPSHRRLLGLLLWCIHL